MLHKDIPVGVDSSHPPGYVQAGDPGAVGAYKVWIDTSSGTGLWVKKVRNAANSGWEAISATPGAHNHAAADITSGTIATARLGSGTADATTFLRGDQTYAVPSGGSGSELPIDAAATASVGSGDLFAGTSLDGGWSDLQATPVTSVDRSVAGYCILKNTGNTAGQDRGLKRTFAPAGDFTVYASIPYATLVDNYQWAGIFIGETDPSDGAGADRLGFHLVINTTLKAKAAKYAAGAETVVFDQAVNNAALMLSAARGDYQTWFPAWLRIKRVGSTVTMGISWDGVQFIDLATTTTIAFTVDTIGIYIGEATATRDIRAVFNYIATTG